jgi:hypothetical protein
MNFMLVVFYFGSNGVPALSVPGYASQALCNNGGQILLKKSGSDNLVYYCIPGPTK